MEGNEWFYYQDSKIGVGLELHLCGQILGIKESDVSKISRPNTAYPDFKI